MIRNYNWYNFSEIEQYRALLALLSKSKKTRRYPVFSIENTIRNEGLLLFLINQKKYITPSRERNALWNSLYQLTRRWKNFIEWIFFSKNDYIFIVVINFVIFILPLFAYKWYKILQEKFEKQYEIILDINILLFIIPWLFIIMVIMIKNRQKRNKVYWVFKKKYNLN